LSTAQTFALGKAWEVSTENIHHKRGCIVAAEGCDRFPNQNRSALTGELRRISSMRQSKRPSEAQFLQRELTRHDFQFLGQAAGGVLPGSQSGVQDSREPGHRVPQSASGLSICCKTKGRRSSNATPPDW